MSGDGSQFGGTVALGGGVLELTSAGAVGSASIVFGGDPTLRIDGATMPTNTISAFVSGDTIDLAGIPFTSGDAASYGSGTLTVKNGGGTVLATLTLSGEPYSADSFFVTGDLATGGTDITTNVPPCFAAGTRLATPRGQIAVEDLRAGDLVLTASGEEKPIVWIGRSRVDCRRHARPEQVIPVRVRAGAFALGMPARDLVLSPGHAILPSPRPSPKGRGSRKALSPWARVG